MPKKSRKSYIVWDYKLDEKNFKRYREHLKEQVRKTIGRSLKRRKNYEELLDRLVGRIIRIQNLPDKELESLRIKQISGDKSLDASLYGLSQIWMNLRFLAFLQSRSRF